MKLSGCNRPNRMNMKRISRISFFIYIALLALSCQEKKPSMVEQRREEIRRNDSTELAQAEAELTRIDSLVTFSTLDVEDMKRRMVFEKQERYQTMGYWVLPSYQGSKERFTFFPEVEESGKLLLVSINGKREYSFTEVDLSSEDYSALLPKGLSAEQRRDVERCYTFAKAMHDLDEARKHREKILLKIRFYQKKIKKDQE